jgi:radical SAM protein with 4Fe4S-binding SPASM domain
MLLNNLEVSRSEVLAFNLLRVEVLCPSMEKTMRTDAPCESSPLTAEKANAPSLESIIPVLPSRATPPLPTFLQVEPVGQCNLACVMCPVHQRTDTPTDGSPAFMPFERYTALLDQFPALEELHLQGLGEPMMHPRFFDMVEHAAARGIKVGCNSNCTLVSDARAERCVTSGLGELHVSLDGATAVTYERIRRGAQFDRVIANILRVQRARQRLHSRTPDVILTAVVMRQNLSELPDLVRLARDLSISSVFVQHLGQELAEPSLPSTYAPFRALIHEQSLLHVDCDSIDAFFTAARTTAQELGITLRLPRLNERTMIDDSARRCDWPWKGAYITYQGYAVPCCMIATPDRAHFGNVHERGVEDVWHGGEAAEFRRRLDSPDPPDPCRSCAVYKGVF